MLEQTGQEQLSYVGHSMGTTSFWVMMNWRPWMNSKVRHRVYQVQRWPSPDPADGGDGSGGGCAQHVLSTEVPVPRGQGGQQEDVMESTIFPQVETVLRMTGQYEFGARNSLFSDISETLCQRVGRRDQRRRTLIFRFLVIL